MNLPTITNGNPRYTIRQLFAAATANRGNGRIIIVTKDNEEIQCDVISKNVVVGNTISIPHAIFANKLLDAQIQSGAYVKTDEYEVIL